MKPNFTRLSMTCRVAGRDSSDVYSVVLGTYDRPSILQALFPVKQFLGFKKYDWPVFNEKMQKFIHMQQEEVDKSLVNLAQYVLTNIIFRD